MLFVGFRPAQLWDGSSWIGESKRSQLSHTERFQLRRNQEVTVGVRRPEASNKAGKAGIDLQVNKDIVVNPCTFSFCGLWLGHLQKLALLSISVSASATREVHRDDI